MVKEMEYQLPFATYWTNTYNISWIIVTIITTLLVMIIMMAFANIVVKEGMQAAFLEYLGSNLVTVIELAEFFCNIKRIGPWTWPKVGAVHTYSEKGIRHTPIDVTTPRMTSEWFNRVNFLKEAGLGHEEGSSFQSFKLENYNNPPKALYHGKSQAPIRTERAVSKEGGLQDFWKP